MEIGAAESVTYLWPEIGLAVTAIVVALLARVERLDRSSLGELAVLGASVSVFLAARLAGWGEVWIFERTLVVDGFAVFFKIFIGVATVAALWISLESSSTTSADAGRASALALSAALGLDLMVSAATLGAGYFSVELATLSLWLLIPSLGGEPPSLSGRLGAGAASLAMLCGGAWLAGFSRSIDYEHVHHALFDVVLRHPLTLTVATMAFLAGFPSRVWVTVSARESRATPSLDAFVAVAFTAAGLALSIRVLYPVLSTPGSEGRWAQAPGLDWTRLVSVAAVAAMTIGNLGALRERSLSRLLVATALAHLGYALLGISSATDDGLQATLFYVAAFAVAALGAFHIAAIIERARGGGDLACCYGLLEGRSLRIGVALTLFVLSLAGMPLLVGFRAKLHLFANLLAHDLDGLAAIGLVNCAASLVAYGRVLRAMARKSSGAAPIAISAYDACFTTALAAATVFFGIHESPLFDLAGRSIQLLPR